MLEFYYRSLPLHVTIDFNTYGAINCRYSDTLAVYNTCYGFPNRIMDATDTSGTDDQRRHFRIRYIYNFGQRYSHFI